MHKLRKAQQTIYGMKVLILLLCMVFAFGTATYLPSSRVSHESHIDAAMTELAEFSSAGEIPHFFTHALVAYPKLGFDTANHMRTNYDNDCLTVAEFRSILFSLYERGYALVDIKSTYTENGPTAKRRAFPFPKDKKPFVLSFDDINYYVKKMNRGMNDRLDVDESGRLFTYTQNAERQIDYDNEVVTVLENFIAEHPDFSYNGARGVLCLTGFDGVLGYRTDRDSPTRDRDTASAKRVVAELRRRGWRFACHSYGHYHMKKLSLERFAQDTEKWLNEVRPIVGETDIYVYPYGEWETSGEKHEHLKQSGFRLFCGVGAKDYYARMNADTLFWDRKPLDGYSLRNFKDAYAPYFDASEFYDASRPTAFTENNRKTE